MNEDQEFSNYLGTVGKLIDAGEPVPARRPRIFEGLHKPCLPGQDTKYSVLPYCVQLKVFKHFGLEYGQGSFVVLRESRSSVGYILEKLNGQTIMLGLETPELKEYRLVNGTPEPGYDLKVQQIVYDIYRERRAGGQPLLGNTITVLQMAERASRSAKRFQSPTNPS